jgi:prolyl oligopeptidase
MVPACSDSEKTPPITVDYPKTEKIPVIDDYFGTKVTDNYRWLEDDKSEETEKWVKAQNKVSFGYLEQISFRQTVRNRFNELADFESYSYIRGEYRLSVPIKKNGKIFYFKNTGLQNHASLYAIDIQTKDEQLVLDPNAFSTDGTVSLSDIEFSESGKYIAYAISESGSDWRKIVVLDSKSLKPLEDTIVDAKFTSIDWNGDKGFYYATYDKPLKGSSLSGVTDKHKIYYHCLGTSQASDVLFYGHEKEKRRYVGLHTYTHSEYLFLSAAESTSGNELYIKKGSNTKEPFKVLVPNFDNDYRVFYADGEDFYLYTNFKAPNGRIMKANAASPAQENWIDFVTEKDEVIESASFAGGSFFVHYLKDAKSKVYQYNIDGEFIREVQLPDIGSVSGFFGNGSDKDVFYSFESFVQPTSIYRLDASTGKSTVFKKPQLKINQDDYETKQVFYTSKDGTRIPMFIVCKKGVKLNGQNPTLLYGYGGFNISLPPYFSLRWLSWLDMGGVFALANIRGGGEYGEVWHKAGMQMNKQNVFDDFIAAANYLQVENYTSSEKLTIMGGSNGGLLVGACMLQQPDLFKVALPAVGVLDMLRYHKFTAGAGWITDYGCADSSKAMFDYLYAYSPVHNVKAQSYPATLITTGDHDDRVVPAHSFKFAAQLQDKQLGANPVLIRIETKGGHGAGKSTSMFLDELADEFSFAYFNMNAIPEYYKK